MSKTNLPKTPQTHGSTESTGSTGATYVRELFGKYLPEGDEARAQVAQGPELDLTEDVLAKVFTPQAGGAAQDSESQEGA